MLDEFTYKSDGSFGLPSDIGTKIMQQFVSITKNQSTGIIDDWTKLLSFEISTKLVPE